MKKKARCSNVKITKMRKWDLMDLVKIAYKDKYK